MGKGLDVKTSGKSWRFHIFNNRARMYLKFYTLNDHSIRYVFAFFFAIPIILKSGILQSHALRAGS